MRITPLDVRKQEIRKAVRGFDCDEVRAFLSTLADEYETVLVDNKQIRELIMEQEDKIQEYQGMERNLRDTLMTAERVMKETRENASKEGGLIVKDAEMKARQVLEECRLRTEELRREIMTLRKEKESYVGRFKALAQAQIKFVETHESDFEDLDNRLTNIVDSVVATATRSRRKEDSSHSADRAPAPAPKVELDPFAPDNRVAGDPSAPRDDQSSFLDTPEDQDDSLQVAPPAAPMENDIWRDYDPVVGQDKNGDNAGSIADLVSESLAETEPGPVAETGNTPEKDKDNKAHVTIADGPVLTNGADPVGAGASKDTI